SANVAVGEIVTATATDIAGNTSEFSACTIAVPASCILACAPDRTVAAAPSQCGNKVDFNPPEFFGSCGSVVCSPTPGSVFPLGTTAVECTSSGGGTCSFNISVVDVTPPVIACPGDVVTGLGAGQQTKTVTFQAPAFDNCSQPSVTCLPPSGSQFPLGVTTVICRSRDDANNEGSCSFLIRVTNSVPPGLQCPSNINVVAA